MSNFKIKPINNILDNIRIYFYYNNYKCYNFNINLYDYIENNKKIYESCSYDYNCINEEIDCYKIKK